MKISVKLYLIGAMTTLACASCSKGPEEETGPVAGPTGQAPETTEQALAENTNNPDASKTETIQNGINVKRLRLPDMEKLPSERELASRKDPDEKQGGVIARPPSE